jgi:hypothetical protein
LEHHRQTIRQPLCHNNTVEKQKTHSKDQDKNLLQYSRLPLCANSLDDLLHDTGVTERAHIAQLIFLPRKDLAQDTAHDLARAGLGQVVDNDDTLRCGERTDRATDLEDQFPRELRCALYVVLEGDERIDGWELAGCTVGRYIVR